MPLRRVLALAAVLLAVPAAAPAHAAKADRGAPLERALGRKGLLVPGSHRATFADVAATFGQTPARAAYLRPLGKMLAGIQLAGGRRAWIVDS